VIEYLRVFGHIGFFCFGTHELGIDSMLKLSALAQARGSLSGRVLLDMNTQVDLLLPSGAMPVVNRVEVLPNIRRLMSWARAESLLVISSLECGRIGKSRRGLPPYCMDGSVGQRKIPITLLPRRLVVQNDNTVDVPPDPLHKIQQVILMKRSRDFLLNPKVDRLFQALSGKHVVVFGAVAERCVKSVVLGLLARWLGVGVVTDACGAWSAEAADMAMRQMEAKGAVLVTTDELISGAVDEWLQSKRPIPMPAEEEPVAQGPDCYAETL
jgi:nicotinamidase-related amidase